MQPREKLLAAVVGGLLLLLGVYLVYGRVARAFSEKNGRLVAARGELEKRKAKEKQGQQAAQRLADWEHRSLPANRELASSLYAQWLTSVAAKGPLSGVKVSPGQPQGGGKRSAFSKLPFTVSARGTLEQATRFLHEFYLADHLQQMRSVSFKPLENGRDIDLIFTIEALVLPGADRTDRLNSEPADRLVSAALKDYSEPIVKRNLFAQWVAPRPERAPRSDEPPPARPPSFDASKFAVLTAILSDVDDQVYAWVHVKTSGETMKLREGDKVEIGEFKGTVVRIGVADIEVEIDGKRKLLAVGKSLPQAIEVPSPGR